MTVPRPQHDRSVHRKLSSHARAELQTQTRRDSGPLFWMAAEPSILRAQVWRARSMEPEIAYEVITIDNTGNAGFVASSASEESYAQRRNRCGTVAMVLCRRT